MAIGAQTAVPLVLGQRLVEQGSGPVPVALAKVKGRLAQSARAWIPVHQGLVRGQLLIRLTVLPVGETQPEGAPEMELRSWLCVIAEGPEAPDGLAQVALFLGQHSLVESSLERIGLSFDPHRDGADVRLTVPPVPNVVAERVGWPRQVGYDRHPDQTQT